MKKNCFLIGALSTLMLAGCGKNEETSAAGSASAPPPAMPELTGREQEPAAPVAAAPDVPEIPPVELKPDEPLGGDGRPLTPDEVNLLNYGLYMFNEDKGRFPTTLEEAVRARYILRLPSLPPGERFDYNPQNGMVKVVKDK